MIRESFEFEAKSPEECSSIVKKEILNNLLINQEKK